MSDFSLEFYGHNKPFSDELFAAFESHQYFNIGVIQIHYIHWHIYQKISSLILRQIVKKNLFHFKTSKFVINLHKIYHIPYLCYVMNRFICCLGPFVLYLGLYVGRRQKEGRPLELHHFRWTYKCNVSFPRRFKSYA